MTSLETPPGFVLKNDLLKAADDLGFRIDHGLDGPWHVRSSTTAKGRIFLSGEGNEGPWYLAVQNPAIVSEINLATDARESPGHSCYKFDRLEELRAAIDRVYKLGVSLPDAPLEAYRKGIEGKPQGTEVERLVIQRVGQSHFRQALLNYWNGRCVMTGIEDADLLRASHIKPWARCASDTERLDVHNGLLLSALWDAAFDKGLVTFNAEMTAKFSTKLTERGRRALEVSSMETSISITAKHVNYLEWHKVHVFQN